MEHWWKSAKIYELYIDKFAKNLNGLTAQLPYFEALGINCLHLLPHYPSPMVDDGYDISDYRNVRPELGTMEDFGKLLREARSRNIRIILDLVLNHTSDQHPWFIEARASKDNPKRNYYLWSETGTEFPLCEPAMPDVNDSIWTPNPDTNDFYFTKFYARQPDLNWDNEEVFKEMMDVMFFWADMGVSGFRIDAAPHLIKREGTNCRSLPETHAVIKKIRAALEAKYPEVILLAEAHESIEDTKKFFGDGDECHMAYHFNLMEQMWVALHNGEMLRVQEMTDASAGIPDNCSWAIFLRNHDEISLATLEPGIRSALVAFLDPDGLFHFKKGEAASVRMGSVFRGDREGMRRAFKLLYSLPGAPIMYYGDEIGMSNLPHEEGIADSRKYVRGEFDWARAEEQMADPTSLWHEVATLIKGIPQTPTEDPTAETV
jgi:maltose alpha-D-glucosyltransferase / alpha-amylase